MKTQNNNAAQNSWRKMDITNPFQNADMKNDEKTSGNGTNPKQGGTTTDKSKK